MSILTKSLLLLGLPLMALSAQAAPRDLETQASTLSGYIYKARNASSLSVDPAADRLRSLGDRLLLRAGALRAEESAPDYQPVGSLTTNASFGDVDLPGGRSWFYTLEAGYEYIVHNEYWTEAVVRSYTITLYDENRRLVGVIDDDFPYLDDEVRSPYFDLTPIVTQHFFNDSDDYEVMVAIATNTSTPGVVRTRTVVYSLDPASSEPVSEPATTIDGFVNDVCDATVSGGEENVYLTFIRETNPGMDIYYDLYDRWCEGEEVDAWNDWFIKLNVEIDTYGRVDEIGMPTLVHHHEMLLHCLPGDQESTPMVISLARDGKAYLVMQQYGEPFYNPYSFDYNVDLTQREGNTLTVEIFELDGLECRQIQSTYIPVVRDEGETVLYTYYSIGDFRWHGDIRWREDGKADFFLTTQNYVTTSDELSPSSYYAYSEDGTLQAILAQNTSGTKAMHDVEGCDPQQMFVEITDNADINYVFVNLRTFQIDLVLNYLLRMDGCDPDPISLNFNRTAYGDSYAYVGEMRYPIEDDGLTFMRFAWIGADGEFIRMDEVNMGENIEYAQSYLNNAAVLRPGFYVTGDDIAYMILLKRGTGSAGTQEELLIAEPWSEQYPDGRSFLHLVPCEKGSLRNIYPIISDSGSYLVVSYLSDDELYTVDTYALPLDGDPAGVEGVVADRACPFSFDGSVVSVPAQALVRVFSLGGRVVASGLSSVSVASLAPGVYVVESQGAARKLIVK